MILRYSFQVFLTLFFVFVQPSLVHANACKELFTQEVQANKPWTWTERSQKISDELIAFAKENGLPIKKMKFGPPDRLVERVLVPIDVQNAALVKKFDERFNMDTVVAGNRDARTMAIEFGAEPTPETYIYGYIKNSADANAQVLRKVQEGTLEFFRRTITDDNKKDDIVGLAHLFLVSPAEIANINYYFKNPDMAAPCKSANCVSWIPSLELGVTAKDSSNEVRRILFDEIGVSRTIAHFEISRRLLHAANENHTAIAVLVDGAKGLATFNSDRLLSALPPEPKIPYSNILKNYASENAAAEKALSIVPDGARVFFPIAAGASPQGLDALIHLSKTMEKGIDVHLMVNGLSERTLRDGIETTDGKFRVQALFLGGNLRALHKEGKVEVIPGYLADFARMIRNQDVPELKYDAIVVRVSPPVDGKYSLGPNYDHIKAILESHPNIKVIAEVNPNVPFVAGSNYLREEQIHTKFDSTTELAGPTTVPPNIIDATLGRHLGSLVASDGYLQVGIGNVFSGLPQGLREANVRNIKIHSEMFGDQLKEIVEQGTATSAQTAFAFGSKTLYDWLANNPKIEILDVESINSIGTVSSLERFHAINTALQVNLSGEVNATMGPDGRLSSPGGQVEFMTGATRSPGGKAIIAIRSTAKNHEISTIVLDLYKGPITTPHESVTHVVTEYGIAVLVGKSEAQRAINLINVAHPNFRQTIFDQAVERGILKDTHRDQIQFNVPEI